MKELHDRGGRAVDSLRRVCIRQLTSAYVSMHTSAYVSIRSEMGVKLTRFVGSDAYVSLRQHTSAHCQHTSAYVSRGERAVDSPREV
jgi:hypothetical protein